MRFRSDAEQAAVRWKQTTSVLPDDARDGGPYRNRGSYPFCLPVAFSRLNLLPEAKVAIKLFAAAGIPWHDGIDSGPSNHLLSSQVQCANALVPMRHDPAAIRAFFGQALDVAEALPIGEGAIEDPSGLVAFEWIGADDPLHEWRGGLGTRGAHNTSADAAIRYRTHSGTTELALIEWKYVEDYTHAHYDDAKLGLRMGRYRELLADADGPIRADFDPAALICEPIYQLMRLQLLAHVLERRGVADVVRLVVCAPAANTAYWHSIPEQLRQSIAPTEPTADHLASLWPRLLRRPDRFAVIDTATLTTPGAPTSNEYQTRYTAAASVRASVPPVSRSELIAEMRQALAHLDMVATRVLGDGSVLGQIDRADETALADVSDDDLRAVRNRAAETAELLRRLRAEPLFEIWSHLGESDPDRLTD